VNYTRILAAELFNKSRKKRPRKHVHYPAGTGDAVGEKERKGPVGDGWADPDHGSCRLKLDAVAGPRVGGVKDLPTS